jgi:hypothetical protein
MRGLVGTTKNEDEKAQPQNTDNAGTAVSMDVVRGFDQGHDALWCATVCAKSGDRNSNPDA